MTSLEQRLIVSGDVNCTGALVVKKKWEIEPLVSAVMAYCHIVVHTHKRVSGI